MTLLVAVLPMAGKAQRNDAMSSYQSELQTLFRDVFHAPTDNERYNANEQVVDLFHQALQQDRASRWDWQLGKEVSVLTSSDRKFRIITWAVVRDNGEYECFGFVSVVGDNGEESVYTLHDKSDDIMNAEESVLTPDNWYGAVYQDLVETRNEGRSYYTLLGWTGVNALTQRKVIEPICFKGNKAAPQFGQNLFRREKNRRRVVLEYANTAMVNMRYDEQYVCTFENVKKKGKHGRTYSVQVPKDVKGSMIIFDEIGPMVPGMNGLFQYYVPTGTEQAYLFEEGKWCLQRNAFGQDANKKLNKEFAPMQKEQPAYQLNKQQASE